MIISEWLDKKFKNNSISLSNSEKELVFFRQTDHNVLIELARYHLKNSKDKKVTSKKLQELSKNIAIFCIS